MSLSACEKCWETPCVCGYAYRNYSIQERIRLAAAVLGTTTAKLEEQFEKLFVEPAREEERDD